MIETAGFKYKSFNFPVGEKHLEIISTHAHTKDVSILWEFQSNEEIIEIIMLVDLIKQAGLNLISLNIPYIPFSRQDRMTDIKESFSLKTFCNLINSLNVPIVRVDDPHSDVTKALINNIKVREQHDIFKAYFQSHKIDGVKRCLISPDGGALKKIHKLANIVNLPINQFSKSRCTKTGKLTDIKLASTESSIVGEECYIVDDICDGGATFIEIARKLQIFCPSKIVLMVTHGFFTKGISIFNGIIDEIYTRKGRVK